MRNFIVKINGKTYNAEIEEVLANGATAPATAPVARPQAAAPTAPIVAPPPPTAPAAPSAPVPEGGHVINAPIPGTVLKINVSQGATVNKGDVVMLLEAMKMENEIMAPVSGTMTSIHVQSGSAVSTGDILFVIS